jgi:hypothetical protein
MRAHDGAEWPVRGEAVARREGQRLALRHPRAALFGRSWQCRGRGGREPLRASSSPQDA